MCLLISVDCNLRLDKSEGAEGFDNRSRQQYTARYHPETKTGSVLFAELLQFRGG